MKKILTLIILLPILAISFLYFTRYIKNPPKILPTPFSFEKNTYASIESSAPILIIGDSMAVHLSKFKKELSNKLSIDLSKPIKIDTLAAEGDNIFRTLKKLQSLSRLPLIIIFFNNMDEHYENIMLNKDIPTIEKNIKLYKNTNLQSLFLIFPELARVFYTPTYPMDLGNQVQKNTKEFSDNLIQKRELIHYELYKFALERLFHYTKQNNSFIIPITTPINLSKAPSKSCYGSLNKDSRNDLISLKNLIKNKDFKGAFDISNELALLNPYNAEILFLHSHILKKLGRIKEFQKNAEIAKAMDCTLVKPNPIYNEILKNEAKNFEINTFDFHQLLVDESQTNFVFKDNIYPQDFYMELLTKLLAEQLKKTLRI